MSKANSTNGHRWVDGSKLGLLVWIVAVMVEVVAGVQLLQAYPASRLAYGAIFVVLGLTCLSGCLLLTSYRVSIEGDAVLWQRRSLLDWIRRRPPAVRRISPTDLIGFRLRNRLGLERTLQLSLSHGATFAITRSSQPPYAATFDAFVADLRRIAGHKEQRG